MTRSRAWLVVVVGVCSLVASGCGKIDGGGSQGSQASSSAQDNRPVKAGGTLRIALETEPDKLDPTLSRSLVGDDVLTMMCQKLFDLNEKMEVVPQLAAGLPETSADGKSVTIKIRTGLTFADGTVMDANAVKMSLDRHRTLAGSQRRSEISSVSDVAVVDPATVKLTLSSPFSPLASTLADRAGMIMSPAALAAKGDDFGTAPVCIGPFKFATRVAQDRIELVKDPNYYDAAKVKLDKVIYKIITDPTTRLNNLKSGDIDVMNAVSPINVDELKSDSNLRLITSENIGYQGITVNMGNAGGATKGPLPLSAPYAGPLATDPRVRQAFALSIDRQSLTNSLFRGIYTPACGPIAASSPFASDASQACPKHDPAQAKKLLAEAGVPTPVKVSMIVINDADGKRIGEAIKSMAAEGGFDVQLEPTEFASALDIQDAGKFQMFRIGWSGRPDPDGNITPLIQTKASLNVSGYSNPDVDKWLSDARSTQDAAKRKDLYGKVITQLQQDLPIIYLYRTKNLIGASNKVGQLKLYSDYLIRVDTAGFVQ